MKRNKLPLVLLAALLVCAMTVSALADTHYVPDMTKRGSIVVTVKDGSGKAVPGGTLTLYRVAKVQEENGDFTFAYTDAFAGCEYPLDELNSGGLADKIDSFVTAKKITGITAVVDENGRASFDDLELGLYLIRQTKAADKYTALKPFLVTVPIQTGDGCLYNVDASPKPGTVTETKPSGGGGTPTKPPQKPPQKLPPTGQLWWPVPLLALCGLVLVAFGWKRRRYEEA